MLTEQERQTTEQNRRLEWKKQELDNARAIHVQRLNNQIQQHEIEMGVLDQRIAAKREHLEVNRATQSPDLSLPTSDKIAIQRSTARKQLLAERKAKLATMGINY